MNSFQYKLSSLLTTSQDIMERNGFASEYKNLQSALMKLSSSDVTILVCGEFKRGKSSFINALLGENVCPVDIGITTAAISVIRYGCNSKVSRIYGDIVQAGEATNMKTETVEYASIQDYVKGTSIDIANTIMLDIEIPNERLKSGLCIIDTPGVGSMDPRHLFLTLYALPKADAIYFMTAAGEPMTSTERDFFVSHIVPLNKPTRILLNKSDRFNSDEEEQAYVQDIRQKLNEVSFKDPVIIPVSAEKWIKYNTKSDERSKKKSNCDVVLNSISEAALNLRQVRCKEICQDFIKLVNRLGMNLQGKLKSLQNPSQTEEQQQLQETIEELSALQKSIADERSPLRTKIRDIVNKSQRNALNTLSKDSVLLSSERLDILLEAEIKNNENWKHSIINRVKSEISKLSKKMGDMVQEARDQVSKEIQHEIDYTFESQVKNTLSVNPPRKTEGLSSFSLIRQAWSGIAMSGTLSGAVGGGLLWLGVPTLISGLGAFALLGAGICYVARSIMGMRQKDEIAQVKHALAPHITNAMNDLRQHVQEQFEELHTQMLEAMKVSVEQIASQIADAKKMLLESNGDESVKQQNILATQKDLTYIIYVANQLKTINAELYK